MQILLADKQDITRAGLQYVLQQEGFAQHKVVIDKAELIFELEKEPESLVILDYNLFDFGDSSELFILSARFKQVHWVLFSEDLSSDFLRNILSQTERFSVIMKDSPMVEIREGLRFALQHQRFICQHATKIVFASAPQHEERINLTKTETDVLIAIAQGMTTKEIAEKRFSSFHTINTHRKNIFRKLGVNNVHEATKYALRAGLIDAADYYI
jgi:transcriptional regulator